MSSMQQVLSGIAAGMVLLGAAGAAAEPPPVKIGVMLCLTGDCAEWGTSGLKGAQLAAEELNAAGGILGRPVTLVVQDSRDTTPAASVSAFQQLSLDKEITYLVGPTWTVGGMPLAPLIAKRADLNVMSPSLGVKEFNESSENIFNDWPHDEVATRAMASYAVAKGWKKGAIFGSQDPFYQTQTKIFQEEFAKLGGQVTALVEPLPDSRQLKTEALKIKSANPDFVIMTNYQADVIAKELRGIGYAGPVLAIQMEKDRVKQANGALEGVVFAMYDLPKADFTEHFRARFHIAPGISADTAYDAVMLYASAAKQAQGFDPVKIRTVLHETRNFQGASGMFSIDAKGAVDKKPVLWRVKGLDYEKVP